MKNRLRSSAAELLPALLASALAAVLASSLCLAQSSAGGGSIQGTVKDATGAILPNAKLTILHVETGRVTSTATNSEGYYSTPPLNIGKYKVRVEAPGMKAWEGELVLETGRIAELNPVLAAGQVTETVTVSDTVPLVTTTDPADGSTLDSQRIKELPINGRDLNTLLADVTPGVEQIIDVNGGIRTSGLMVYSNDYVNGESLGYALTLGASGSWGGQHPEQQEVGGVEARELQAA